MNDFDDLFVNGQLNVNLLSEELLDFFNQEDEYRQIKRFIKDLIHYTKAQLKHWIYMDRVYYLPLNSNEKGGCLSNAAEQEENISNYENSLKYIEDLLNPDILFRLSKEELNWKLIQVINKSKQGMTDAEKIVYLNSVKIKYLRQRKISPDHLKASKTNNLEKDIFKMGIEEQLAFLENIIKTEASPKDKSNEMIIAKEPAIDNKKKILSNLISKNWDKIRWYGSKENLLDAFNWCLEKKYFDENFRINMKSWLNTCFKLKNDNKLFPYEKKIYKNKVIWYGTISSLLNFLKILVQDFEFIRGLETRNKWICDHFMYYPPNKELKLFNEDSLNELWSNPYTKNIDFNSLKERLKNPI